MTDAITAELGKAAAAISAIDPAQIRKAADIIRDAFRNGNQVIFCGNGGSSADAQHIAAEFSGRYMMERPALPGVCLSNIAPVTAIGNDYSYDIVFKRQVEGICRKGDVLVGLSTSGNSKNVILAMEEAKARGGVTIAFTGDCGRMREIADHAVTIPTTETPHVQEGYLCACHIVAGIVERELFGSRAVFIDRDDTVAKNVPYCDDPDKFEVYPDVPEAIARLNRAGYLVIVITNQSGLNRGYFDLATLDAIHSKLRSTVEAGGGRIDDIFYLPPNVPERYLRHSDGPAAGYGEWGSVLDAYLRLKPEAWLTKKAYSPIRLDEKTAILKDGTLTLPAENRFDHTDLAELTVAIAADGAAPRTVPCPALAPRAKGTLTFGGLADAKTVNLRFRTADGIVVEEVNLALAPSVPEPEPAEPAAPPTLVEGADTLTVRLDDGEATFDRATARLRAFVWQGRTLLSDGPDLVATGVALGAWQGRSLTAKVAGNHATVTLEGAYACGLAVRFDLAFLADGRLEARYTLLSDPPKGAKPSEVGLAFALPGAEAVRWERAAFHSAYPADHIGRPRGVAHRVRPGSDISPDVYGSKPAWPWKDDMRNPFVYAKDDPDDGLATNDFKAMREAIRAYDVLLPGGGALRLRSDGKNQAARVAVSADRALIDDRDPRIRYSAGWAHYATPADHAGTETYSTRRGAWSEFDFEGVGVRVIGAKQANVGLMRILLDGREVATVDTHSDLGSDLKQSVIHTVHGLAPGKHTVRVETAGGHVDCVVVDAFEALPAEGPRIATRLIVCDGWWYPGLAWGNYCGRRPTFAKGTSGKADLRPLPTAPGGWPEETRPPTQGGSAAKSR